MCEAMVKFLINLDDSRGVQQERGCTGVCQEKHHRLAVSLPGLSQSRSRSFITQTKSTYQFPDKCRVETEEAKKT